MVRKTAAAMIELPLQNKRLEVQEEKNNSGKVRLSYNYVLAFSIVLGSFLRFYHIGAQPLWLDEAFSYWYSNKTFLELWSITLKYYESHPPVYYAILKVWTLFGSDETMLRSLSAVMSIGCIPLVFLLGKFLGKSIGGNWLGASAALIFAVSPIHVQYAQEARPYAMLTFATTLTLCAIVWIMNHTKEACTPIFGKKTDLKPNATNGPAWIGKLAWMTTAFAVAFTLWLHNTSVLFILPLLLVVLIWFNGQLKFNKGFFINVMTVACIVSLLWGPYLIVLVLKTKSLAKDFWLSMPTFLSTVNGICWLLCGSHLPSTISVMGIVRLMAFLFLITLSIAGLWNIRRNSGKYIAILIFSSIVGPILLDILFSLTVMPIFLPKTLIYVSVPFYIALAAGIMMLRDFRKRVIALMLISLIFLSFTYNYYTRYRKEPWDKIARIVVQKARNDSVLLFPNYVEIPLSYYTSKISDDTVQTTPLPRPWPPYVKISSDDISQINKLLAKGSTIWLITRSEDRYDPDRMLYNALMQNRQLMSRRLFGEITVYKFVR